MYNYTEVIACLFLEVMQEVHPYLVADEVEKIKSCKVCDMWVNGLTTYKIKCWGETVRDASEICRRRLRLRVKERRKRLSTP